MFFYFLITVAIFIILFFRIILIFVLRFLFIIVVLLSKLSCIEEFRVLCNKLYFEVRVVLVLPGAVHHTFDNNILVFLVSWECYQLG